VGALVQELPKFVGNNGLAEQCFGNPCPEANGDGDHFFGCAKSASADQDSNPFARVEDIGSSL